MIAALSPNGQNVRRGNAPPARVLVATLRGVDVIERAGAGWVHRGRVLDDVHCSSLLVLPDDDVVVAGAHNGGLFVSEDGGAAWERRTNGLAIPHVFSLAYAPRAGGGATLYAGTQPVGLFRSDDLGRTWTELPAIAALPGRDKWWFPGPPHQPHVKTLAVHPHDSRTLYAGVEQGALLRSTDAGATWRELDAYSLPDDKYYRDVHLLVLAPGRPDELFLTTGIGLYFSADAGERWERLTRSDFRIGYPDHLIVSPRDERELFMSGASADPTTWHDSHHAAGTVMRSRDRGHTWADASAGLPQDGRANIEAMSIAIFPGGFTLFAGNTDGAVFASDDAAEHWTPVAAGLAPVSKVGHYRHLQTAGV